MNFGTTHFRASNFFVHPNKRDLWWLLRPNCQVKKLHISIVCFSKFSLLGYSDLVLDISFYVLSAAHHKCYDEGTHAAAHGSEFLQHVELGTISQDGHRFIRVDPVPDICTGDRISSN